MSRIRLAVLFGGRSSEHSISCISAGSVLAAVDRAKYDVVAIGITPEGRWVLAPDDPALLTVRGHELPSVEEKSGTAVTLVGDPGAGGLVVLEPGEVPRELGEVDVVFPLLHGPYGEDGTVQGLLELAGVPYVGSDVLGSAVNMDKHYMNTLLRGAGLPIGPWLAVSDHEWRTDPAGVAARVEAELGYPVFVKPARGGSSIGISKVTAAGDLAAAVDVARQHDPKVLVEAFVAGREIECAVLGGRHGGPPEASVPAEIHVSDAHEYYDFEAKYLTDATSFDIPADVPADTTQQIRDLACRAFLATECAGLARVDFFLLADGSLLVNEVNTMPGFTPTSMYPRMWAASGLGYPALVDRLIELALESGTGLR